MFKAAAPVVSAMVVASSAPSVVADAAFSAAGTPMRGRGPPSAPRRVRGIRSLRTMVRLAAVRGDRRVPDVAEGRAACCRT
jgi:hypothetical protein